MSDINGALKPTHESFFFNSNSPLLSENPNLLTPESFSLERGPKYRAYAELRESRLRKKQRLYEEDDDQEEEEDDDYIKPLPPPIVSLITPPKKKVTFQTFQSNSNGGRLSQSARKGKSTMVAKSVPDFSSVLRKENRKPVVSTFEIVTPPSLKNSGSSKMSRLGGGSKSTGGKGSGIGRKSYASIEELKGLGAGVNSAINGEIKGGRRGVSRTILGYRKY